MIIVQIIRQVLKRIVRTHVLALLVAVLLLVAFGTIGVYLAEAGNPDFATLWDCLWWTLVTMATVGYGDKVPIMTAGRVIAIICMIGGPVLLVSLIASTGATFYNEWTRGVRGMSKIVSRKQILMCGWNPKAREIIDELRLSKKFQKWPITIIDDKIDSKPVDDANVSFVRGSASEVRTLEQANVREASFAVVLAQDSSPTADQKTVLTVLAIESMNPSILSCAELNDANNEEHLRRAGCDVVVTASALTAKLLAMSIENPAFNSVIRELVSRVRGNEIYRVELPERYVDRPFEECLSELKRTRDAIVIGVERDRKCLINPACHLMLKRSDSLLIISKGPLSLK